MWFYFIFEESLSLWPEKLYEYQIGVRAKWNEGGTAQHTHISMWLYELDEPEMYKIQL